MCQGSNLNSLPLAAIIDMTVIVSGGIFVALLMVLFIALLIKGEIDYRRIIKYANESEAERKRQGKTVDEWYGENGKHKEKKKENEE